MNLTLLLRLIPLLSVLAGAAPGLRANETTGQLPFDTIKFTSIDGREIDLAQMRGKVVLLDFWATWCGPCIRELFALKPVHERYRANGFEIVGIFCDKGSAAELNGFLTKQGMMWPQHMAGELKDPASVASRFGVRELPTTFLIGRDGKLVGRNLRGAALELALRDALGLPPERHAPRETVKRRREP